jgi:uncharacterized membrane protein YfcA
MRGVITTADTRDLTTRALVLRLLLVGAVGGAFSALFGVGGGVVMVPLLMLLCGYGSRAATATSLAAIAMIAAAGVATYGALGEVDWLAALLIGIPALLGVTLGVKVRARISAVAISRALAVLLIIAAALLVVHPA